MSAARVLVLVLVTSGGMTFAASQPASTPPDLESALLGEAEGLHPEALHAALSSWEALRAQGQLTRPLLSVIDYSLPSTTRRMWVFDLASERLLYHELVAHGRNSGEDIPQSFSNDAGSYMSSLGAFVTGSAY